jgi:peptidoglycan/LPS O-acetylase OafA/YrhL
VVIGIDGVWAWVANLFVLQAFGSTVPYGITQAWSIGVEISFYLALPLWAPLVHRAIARRTTPQGASHPVVDPGRFAAPVVVRLLVAAGALWVAGNVFRIVVVVAGPGWQGRSLNWLPMYLDLFAVGMLLAVVSAVVAEGAVVPRVFLWAGRHPVWCWVVAAAGLVLVAQMEPPPEPFMLNGAEYIPRQFGYGVIAAVWLAPAIFGDQRAGRLRAVLASRPMVYLADLSLSFYLWHLAFVDQAKEWTVPGYRQLEGLAVFTGSFPLVLLVATAATLVVSAVVYHLVERPFLRLKDGRVRATPPEADRVAG